MTELSYYKEKKMTKLKIVIAPDQRLNTICSEVKRIEKGTLFFIENMVETMYESNGIGLAAPQVGIMDRILVMDCSYEENDRRLKKIINPEIIKYSDELSEHEEGCLSLPQQFAKIERPSIVKVRYLDVNGDKCEEEFEGLESTCLQHEIDHLNGKLFIDHISKLRKKLILKKLQKYKKVNNL